MLENKKLSKGHKSIRISPGVLIQLKKISDKTGLTFSELIREAIKEFILKYKGEVKLIPRKEINLNEKTT